MRALRLQAGPEALARVRERGLSPDDVDVVPGASGGPKWLVLARLDRAVFGEFFAGPRSRPLHLVGSSIGSWRLACFAQADPAAALARFERAYVAQRYPARPPPALVTRESVAILEELLGPRGADEVVGHPWKRLHVITALTRGLLASERASVQGVGLVLAALGNVLHRRTLGVHMRRVVFHTAGDASPFLALRDFPSEHRALTAGNVRQALMASGSIPLVLAGVPGIPGGPPGVYRDGGIVDYHLDLDFGPGEGLVLYPHFYPRVIPGWFDKGLKWRRARAANFRRVVLVSPSDALVASLPGGRIPDRDDFTRYTDAERFAAWGKVLDASERMADEWRELAAKGTWADRLEAL